MIKKFTDDFYRGYTKDRTYEFEKNSAGSWDVNVYTNNQGLNEEAAFIPRESGNIALITEADEFVSKNEQLING